MTRVQDIIDETAGQNWHWRVPYCPSHCVKSRKFSTDDLTDLYLLFIELENRFWSKRILIKSRCSWMVAHLNLPKGSRNQIGNLVAWNFINFQHTNIVLITPHLYSEVTQGEIGLDNARSGLCIFHLDTWTPGIRIVSDGWTFEPAYLVFTVLLWWEKV